MRIIVNTTTGQSGDYADWVQAFSDMWRNGHSSASAFTSLMGANVKLTAPGFKTTYGKFSGEEAFRRTFLIFPDLTGRVHRWSANSDTLFIEMTFLATIGGRKIEWENVDRILFRDGFAIERTAYFNPTKLRKAMLRNPRGWHQLLKLVRADL